VVGARIVYDVWLRVGDREISKTFIRRKDADAYAATMEVDKLRGVTIDPRGGRLTVEELARRWLDTNPAKRPDSRATDEYHLRAHILPVLGKRQIASVTPSHVQALANDLSARLAPNTVRRALGVVRAMFAHGVASDLLGRSPCRAIKLPRLDPTRRRIPSSEELARLIGAVPEGYRAMVSSAVVLGLRFSEVAGLRVGEVDTLRGMLSVAETVTRDAHGRPYSARQSRMRRAERWPFRLPLRRLLQSTLRDAASPAPTQMRLSSRRLPAAPSDMRIGATVSGCRHVARPRSRGSAFTTSAVPTPRPLSASAST
jgi:integrase